MKSTHPKIEHAHETPDKTGGFRVSIDATINHPHFSFFVGSGSSAGTIRVMPDGAPGTIFNWTTALSPEEKVNVANRILGIYRQRSRNESGFKVAALGVSEEGGLYVAYNGAYNSSRQMRQCAELKMSARAEECEAEHEPDVRFKELYVEGAGPGSHIAGLCGDCTNLMSKLMDPQSPIYIMPGTDGGQWLDLDRDAQSISDIKPGHAWATNMAHLLKHREIKVSDAERDIQLKGIAELSRNVAHWVDRYIEEDPNEAVRSRPPISEEVARKARVGRFHIDLKQLNTYMREQIYLTVADRLQEIASEKRGLGDLKTLDADTVERLVNEEVKWARCAVMQRDDGKLFAAVTIKTKYEPASENAENNAMNQGRRKKGGIHAMYVMEMNPSKAQEGVLRTSAPVAVERQLKGVSKRTGTVDYHYVPFNDGSMSSAEIARAMHHRDAKQLFPTGWNGRYAEKGVGSLVERVKRELDVREAGGSPGNAR